MRSAPRPSRFAAYARSAVVAVPLFLAGGDPIPLEDVMLKGRVDPVEHVMTGDVGTAVRIPFGKITVTGHATLRYGCDGSFTGAIAYSKIIRVLAHLKGVRLVNTVEGSFAATERDSLPPGEGAHECATPRDAFAGRLTIRDTLVTGVLVTGADSVALSGRVKPEGNNAFTADVTTLSRPRSTAAHVRIYER